MTTSKFAREVHNATQYLLLCRFILGMHLFFLIFLMVICTSCQKQFKKSHGLSQHRNKCSALRSEPVSKSKKVLLKDFRARKSILKFKKYPEQNQPSQFSQEDLNGQDERLESGTVRMFLISNKNLIMIYSG